MKKENNDTEFQNNRRLTMVTILSIDIFKLVAQIQDKGNKNDQTMKAQMFFLMN